MCATQVSYNKRVSFIFTITAMVTLFLIMHYNGFSPHAIADTGERGLTDLFETQAFSGSWEVFSKMNFIGWLLNGIISVFCLIGLFLTCLRIMDSMLYLSGRNLWDTVNELKGKGKGQKAVGMIAMGKEVYQGNYGVGLDAFLGFLLALLPNVKAYSDFADGKMSYNLNEDDTITTYILKISLPSILMIFFFSIGFNGVLWSAFGNVVDALGVAAEAFVEADLDKYVDRALNIGSKYKFVYSADGTDFGKFCQKVAESTYNKVLNKTTDLSSDSSLAIGGKVDSLINSNIFSKKSELDKALNTSLNSGNDADAKNLEYSVIVNQTKEYPDASGYKISCDIGSLGLVVDDKNTYYVHIFITKKANSNETNYFEYNTDGKGGTSGSSGNKPTNSTITINGTLEERDFSGTVTTH